MTISKALTTLLLASLFAGNTVSAQQRRTTNTRVTVTHQDDDEDHVVPTRSRHQAVIDSRSFYRTPYRTRNSGSYDLDTRILSFGFGFPNTLRTDYGGVYNDRRSGFGPLMAKFEYAVHDEIGIGVVVDGAYAQWKYNLGAYSYRDHAFGLGVSFLGYYHFNKLIPVRDLDVYGGVGVNISHVAYHDDRYDRNSNQLDVLPSLVIGARYYVGPSFAPYFELGRTNYSWVNLGVSFGL